MLKNVENIEITDIELCLIVLLVSFLIKKVVMRL